MEKKPTIYVVTTVHSAGYRTVAHLVANMNETFPDYQLERFVIDLEHLNESIQGIRSADLLFIDYFLHEKIPQLQSELPKSTLVETINIGSFTTMSAVLFAKQIEKALRLNALEIRVQNDRSVSLIDYVLPAAKIPRVV